MGADGTAGLTALDRSRCFLPRLALDGARQEDHAHAERLEQLGERHHVLLGQDLGGGHERRLMPGLDRGQDREGRDHRLARADIALEQAAHRVGLGHVDADLAPDALLCRRQRVGQRRAQTAHEGTGRVHGEAAAAALAVAADRQPDFEQKEVVEDEPAASRGMLLLRLRKMRASDRPGQRQQGAAGADALRQRIAELVGPAVHEALHEPPERPLGQPLGQRVDRNQTSRVEHLVRAILDELIVLHHHLERPAAVRLDLAVDDQVLAALEDSGQVRLVEPRAVEKAAHVPDHHDERHARPPARGRADARDGAGAGAGLSHRDASERGDLAPVFVAQRQVLDEGVLNGAETDPGQRLCALGPDTGDVSERRPRPRGRLRRGGLAPVSRLCSRRGQVVAPLT